jgi:hypothetical protein
MEVIDQENKLKGIEKLPNSGATLILGIFSIMTCFCGGIPGLALGIVALVISSNSVAMYKANPGSYTGYSEIQAGRITAIIGISISSIYLLFFIATLSIWGLALHEYPEALENFLNSL